MANLTIRRNKGAALTHDELDNNFVALNNDIIDSSQIIDLIDSAYVQARQITYDFLDSAEAIALIDSAYVQARQTTYDFLDSAEVINLVDSAYVQSRVTLRDSSFVTGLIDSNYISNRSSSGGLGGIEFSSTSSSVTKVGDGDVFVELSGGGGAKGYAITPGGTAGGKGGNSNGRGVLNNVADGSVITFTIGNGGSGNAGGGSTYGATGGSTTVYVDSANGQKLVITGGVGGTPESLGGDTGATVVTPTASGGATALTGHGLIQSPLGQGAQSGVGGTAGSDGCILLIGV